MLKWKKRFSCFWLSVYGYFPYALRSFVVYCWFEMSLFRGRTAVARCSGYVLGPTTLQSTAAGVLPSEEWGPESWYSLASEQQLLMSVLFWEHDTLYLYNSYNRSKPRGRSPFIIIIVINTTCTKLCSVVAFYRMYSVSKFNDFLTVYKFDIPAVLS